MKKNQQKKKKKTEKDNGGCTFVVQVTLYFSFESNELSRPLPTIWSG